jgi:cytochrome P450
MLKLQKRYGDIVALGQTHDAPVVTFAPEYNHFLLTDTSLFYNLDVNSSAAPLRMPQDTAASRLLSGVAGMNGEEHRWHRRMLMPAFGRKRVDALRDTMVSVIEEQLGNWQPGQRFDLVHRVIELALALDVSGLLGLHSEEAHEVHALLQQWGSSALSIPVNLLPLDVPGMPFRRFMHLSEELENKLKEIMKKKWARMKAGEGDTADALSILLQVHGGQANTDGGSGGFHMTESQLVGHVATLFSSGHETTASALTWTLFLLSQHPQVLHDLMDELDAKLHGEAPTLEQLEDLPLLDAVIDESLRMFPPGMWMLRTSTAPFELGPYHLPTGTHLVFSPAVTHRRPDIYAEPNRFMPSRWETIDPTPYEFLPFGAGPRRCLGATFAMMELRLAVPMIVQRFRIEVPDGTRVDRSGTVLSFPRGGLPIVLHPQDRKFRGSKLRGNIYDLLQVQ